jgi:hypothetical protein
MTKIDEADDEMWAIPEVGDVVTVDEGVADDTARILQLGEDLLHEGMWPATIRWESTGVEVSGTVYWEGLRLFIGPKE